VIASKIGEYKTVVWNCCLVGV